MVVSLLEVFGGVKVVIGLVNVRELDHGGGTLWFVSLDGLGLEAVRDRQAGGGGGGCGGGWWRLCPMVQASWCSMKLSTLEKTRPQSQEWPLVPQVLR